MAISLFISCMTGQRHAILFVLVAGHVWPFMNSSVAGHLPSPYDVAGPTLTAGVDIIRVDWQDEVGQLYARMEGQQKQSSRYQYVPQSMLSQLNRDSHGMRVEAMRQVFNWIPRKGREADALSGLRVVGVPGQDDIPPAGAAWMCRLVDPETLSFRWRWNSGLVSEEEGARAVERVLRIAEWICEPENWHEQIGKVLSKMRADES